MSVFGSFPTNRLKRRPVKAGSLLFGLEAPILVQSMTTTDTRDISATLNQIEQLANADCELVRVAVLNSQAAKALPEICKHSKLPVVADIHYDHRLALAAIEAGVVKLRINPGNMGDKAKVREVAKAAAAADVAIRVGVNSASLEKGLLDKHGGATPQAMVESAVGHIHLLEDAGFESIIVSIKAPDVSRTVMANRMIAEICDYPLHICITHAGPPKSGIVASSIGLGILLAEGIGDTVRVSLTGDPVLEVETAYLILESLKLRQRGACIVSCPTCGRCQVDLAKIVSEVEEMVRSYRGPAITIAVMGCEVNGPGEGKEADIGIAAGQGMGLLFVKGEVIAKVEADKLCEALQKQFSLITGFAHSS